MSELQPQTPFEAEPRRDASSAVRGFVYQADRTIGCWLGLASEVELHLECGEDIDVVGHALGGQRDRLLEQVKHEASALTLRSPSAVAAIANFVGHRHRNPTIDLQFRFLTTSSIGKEQMESVSEKGILLWRRVAQAQATSEREGALRDIRRILQRASRPPKYNKNSWDRFTEWWQKATDEQLLDLIGRFEWICEHPSSEQMQPQLLEQLLRLGHAQSQDEAQELYARLLVYVLKLLARDGAKILSQSELQDVLSRPLNAREREFFNLVITRVAFLEEKMGDIQSWRQDHSLWAEQQQAITSRLEAQCQQILTSHKLENFRLSTDDLHTVGAPLSVDIPPPVANLSTRELTVTHLARELTGCRWLWLEGAIGMGKTHLAILLARYHQAQGAHINDAVFWLSFRNYTPAQVQSVIEVLGTSLVGPSPARDREAWFQRALNEMGEGALLVLDDLPRMNEFEGLGRQLVDLAHAAEKTGVRLLSTSHHTLPTEIEERLGRNVRRLPCPSLKDLEAREILLANGAPPARFSDKLVEIINGFTHGHPVLLTAFCRYLDSHEWRFGDDEWESLLRSKFTASVNEQTVGRLIGTASEDGRDFLLRLNTNVGSFSLEEARLLAAVAPAIPRPSERLQALTGLWVQHVTDDKYQVSPLVKALGEADLPSSTRLECHHALARHILRKGRVNQFDLSNCVLHFSSAEEWDTAGSLLVHALDLMWQQEKQADLDGERPSATRPRNDAGLLSFWVDMPLPAGMSFHLRLLIRAHHVALRHRWGEDNSYQVHDLLTWVSAIEEKDTWVTPILLMVAGSPLAEQDFGCYCGFLSQILAFAELPMSMPDGGELKLPSDVSLEWFLWESISKIRNYEDLCAWLQVVEELKPESRARAFEDEIALTGCREIGNSLWSRELDKREEDRDWPTAIERSRLLAERAFQVGVPLLGAALVQATITMESENCHDLVAASRTAEWGLAHLDQASAVTSDTMQDESDVQSGAFLIEDGMGRAFGFNKRFDEAHAWLLRATSRGGRGYGVQRMVAYICLAQALASSSSPNSHDALEFARHAVAVSRERDVDNQNRARALGELSIAAWLANDLAEAFTAMDEAWRTLLACRDDSARWKGIFVMLGHVLGYLTSLASSGNPPPMTEDGEPYMAPHQTILLGFNALGAALYNPAKEPLLYVQLMGFAAGVGRHDKAKGWGMQAYDIARPIGMDVTLVVLSFQLITDFVEEGRAHEVMFLARVRARAAALRERSPHDGGLSESPDAILQPLPSPDPQSHVQIEQWTIVAGLVPLFLRAATRVIVDGEANAFTDELIVICREEFERSGDRVWNSIIEVVEQTFFHRPNHTFLLESGNACAESDVVRSLWYLGATLQADIPPPKALEGQLAVLPAIQDWSRANEGSFERIIAPFLFAFWKKIFEEKALFFDPFLPLRDGMRDAESQPAQQGVRQLLIIMSVGLKVGGTLISQEWLRQE